MPARPLVDPENFNAGYLMRKMRLLPKQGDHQPWIFSQDYYTEKDEIAGADLEDGTLVYRPSAATSDQAPMGSDIDRTEDVASALA